MKETILSLKLVENLASKSRLAFFTRSLFESLHFAICRARRFPSHRRGSEDDLAYLTAYKNAMQRMAKVFPTDADVHALYAESVMNLSPWDYYSRERDNEGIWRYTPKPDTRHVIAALDTALKLEPDHLLALHLSIHVHEVDARAIQKDSDIEGIARRLQRLVEPISDEVARCGIGHLLHMPSHIWKQVGRYEEANRVNKEAIAMAEAYYAHFDISERSDSFNHFHYTTYFCHRITFVVYASMMSGQFEV